MSAINRFSNEARPTLRENPCISPDSVWTLHASAGAKASLANGKSRFTIALGSFTFAEDTDGDCAWV